ncbi:MAG: hypothetical protein COS89_01875 [Deltaproteobacteria bacterium CG07_land_8_20_14_0_80_38_7]|nr:MAG: hypothetical protein COS89_01875 [Deltaproteobacteria bacterium CG07_land_8_20_14_0_80_38_7]
MIVYKMISGTVYIYPIQNLIFDSKFFYTTFGTSKQMFDWDIAMSYKYKLIGVRGGYRIIWSNKNKTLHGPEIGVFVQW